MTTNDHNISDSPTKRGGSHLHQAKLHSALSLGLFFDCTYGSIGGR